MKKTHKINTQIAEHFNWGTHCDGWFLANNPNLCILQEKMPAGTMEEKHYHEKTWQFFFIISGTATMEIDNVQHLLGALDGIEVQPQVPHKIVNNTNQDLVFIVVSTPNHKLDRVNVGNHTQEKQIEIKSLMDCKEHIPQLAELWYEEISRHWAPNASIEKAKQKLNEHLNDNKTPMALVALQNKKPIGMACLRENDGIRPGISPWLGSLVVHPKHRGQAIGEMLIDAIKSQAKALNYPVLYLLAFDPTIPNWYTRLGWQFIGTDELFGHPVAVMSISL